MYNMCFMYCNFVYIQRRPVMFMCQRHRLCCIYCRLVCKLRIVLFVYVMWKFLYTYVTYTKKKHVRRATICMKVVGYYRLIIDELIWQLRWEIRQMLEYFTNKQISFARVYVYTILLNLSEIHHCHSN